MNFPVKPFFAAALFLVVAYPSRAADPYAPDYATEMVSISGGSFRMGSLDGNRDERPVREVTVGDFAMGHTEVTVGWYLRCMADSACEAPSWWFTGYFEDVPAHLTAAERMRLPVTGVSWRQALQFCRWLGPDYDLPTEAEWEYAAGAGKSWKYPWGNLARDRDKAAPRQTRLMPVGAPPANPLGLFGLAGGAWEWVKDCYDRPRGDEPCVHRVTKGGSWSEHTWNLRAANKSFGIEKERYKGLGFRVVRHAR